MPFSQQRPNIVFFFVDDMGWGDLGCYGSRHHHTPHIDRLAREGMLFTNAYAAAPVCSPSRAAALTGTSPARLHLTQWIPGVKYPHKPLLEPQAANHLPPNMPTVASELRKAGYRTALIGKWHLGGGEWLPEHFGFDENFGGGDSSHPDGRHGYFGPFSFHNLTGYRENDYLTEVLSAKVDEFLDRTAGRQPFFLYLAEYAVHLPLQARAALVDKYLAQDPSLSREDATYAAMVETVDTALGQLRAKLEAKGVAQNKVILLTSDNGGVGFQGRNLHRIADNGGLRAGKGYLYEGGVREPLLVHWPGVVRAGARSDARVTGEDIMPTLLRIAGVAASPALDGADFTSVLRGEPGDPGRKLFWHYPHYSDQGGTPSSAMLDSEWKLLEFFETGHLELYNLRVDPGEQYDLGSSFSDKAAVMHRELIAWRTAVNAQMPVRAPAEAPGATAQLRPPHAGCSWRSEAGCLED